jgi:cytochrome c oxidase assembly protein subunit 11
MEDSSEQVWWIAAGLMGVFGAVWALVPLYKMYCQSTGQGQATQTGHKDYSAPPEPNSPAANRLISVDFTGHVHTSLPWEFRTQQKRVVVGLGETALAFYRAKNNSDKPIIGVSVYHMLPAEAGLYFNKIQCFCFDEQLINPGEEVDLPIFFFIDPLMAEDSRFDSITKITLSYLFFESDSELPEGYEDYMKAVPTTKAPPGGIPSLPPALTS